MKVPLGKWCHQPTQLVYSFRSHHYLVHMSADIHSQVYKWAGGLSGRAMLWRKYWDFQSYTMTSHGTPYVCGICVYHEFHETCHFVTFIVLVNLNVHQRRKQTWNRVCFHPWCELTLALWCHTIVWSLSFKKQEFTNPIDWSNLEHIGFVMVQK